MKRIDLRGAAILVALANWSGESWTDILKNIAEALQLGVVGNLRRDRVVASQVAALSIKNATAALLAGTPLIEALTKRRVGKEVMGRLAATARAFLDRGIGLRMGKGRQGLLKSDHGGLEAALGRPLSHRFVLPLWARTGRLDLVDAGVAGWGTWHPMLETPDDLLTWALANTLEVNTVANVGVCAECGTYYYSDRRGQHRFCSSSCRDRHWNRKTGAERTRRSRGEGTKSADRPSTTFTGVGAANHVREGVRR